MKKILFSSLAIVFAFVMSVGVVSASNGEITSPDEGAFVKDSVMLEANYDMGGLSTPVHWAVRKGTCAVGTNTVLGNVDSHTDVANWDGMNFSYDADISGFTTGMYCFIFNPGPTNIDRYTREFYVVDGMMSGGGQIIEEFEDKKSKEWHKISFGGAVAEVGATYLGEWEVNFHNVGSNDMDKSKFHTTKILDLDFQNPIGNCEAKVLLTAKGELNGVSGFVMKFRAGDNLDTIRIEILDPAGDPVYDTTDNGEFTDESKCAGKSRTGLDRGNITIVR